MLKTRREYIAGAEIDRLEKQWWEQHAGIVDQCWDMDEKISLSLRKHYLKKARKFLTDGKSKVNILELGCGSGWVGQAICGPDLSILGLDFSETQVAMARQSAGEKNRNRFCTYSTKSIDELDQRPDIDGVLIHAFLHHLDGKELEELFLLLRVRLPKGTRVWIYEPSFYREGKSAVQRRSVLTDICMTLTSKILAYLHRFYERFDLIDKKMFGEMRRLFREAEAKGWYLSPKEIPLDIDDFSKFLEENGFRIIRRYWATIFLITRFVRTNLIRNKKLRRFVNFMISPLFVYTDRRLTLESEFLESKMVAPNHAFYVWECILE